MLRSILGIIIGETILDKENLSKYLLRVPGLSTETVADLVNPEDPQDVPRAVALMQALIKLSKLPSTGLNPKEQKDTGALVLLGVMLSSLLEPFIDTNMTLTTQMTSLATYAFISFAIFKLHGTSFSSNQLYADCQTMIKNAYFCVRKQQCMSPTSPFFLIQLGDDRLELHFCEVRCATHQCNVDISELAQKTAAAMDRHEIFERHRDWDRGHRRLKFVDSIAVDHVNPRSWTGDNIVGAVCLESTWQGGRAAAEAALTTAQIPFNFNEFRQDGDSPLDMLRPHGNDIYPAVAPGKDRSIEELTVLPRPPAASGEESASAGDTAAEACGTTDKALEMPIDRSVDMDRDMEPIEDWPSRDTDAASSDDSDDEDGVDLDDILPDIEHDEAEDGDCASEKTDIDWITCDDGHKWHKASLIRKKLHLDRNHTGKKSKNRKERVRVFTHFNDPTDFGVGDPLGDSIFTCNSPAVTLIRSGNALCLAILSVHSLEKQKKRVMAVEIDEMALISSEIRVSAQVLQLHQLDSVSWAWTGTYASLPPVRALTVAATAKAKAGKSAAKRQMLVTLASHLVLPINPEIVPTSTIPGWNVAAAETTWKFKSDSLDALATTLLEAARAGVDGDAESNSASVLGLFPRCGVTDSLPYRFESESQFHLY